MEIFKEIEPLRAFLNSKREKKKSIGLVPTMGALHQGHLALIRASKNENQLTVCSIYVNPTQFNNAADLEKYPRAYQKDVDLLTKEQCDVLFVPSDAEMYDGSRQLKFDFGSLDSVLEGKFRPGHFSGVSVIVSKLFNITQPNRVYFGQKDYQQLQIIKLLKEELKFPLQICSVPIEREKSGLALSSRNQRLSETDRRSAILLFESLKYALLEIQNQTDLSIIKNQIEAKFESKPGMRLEYFELVDRETLELQDEIISDRKLILLIAAYVNEVRLIDNMFVDS